jgi:virulence-associated protein VagC
VILDSDGRVQAVRLGQDGTFEELDRLLATAVGET